MARRAVGGGGFGQRLRRVRERAGLTQERLAELAGLSRPWLGKIESGRAEPNVSDAIALFDVVAAESPGLRLEWLLAGRGPEDARVEDEVRRRHFARLLAAGVLLGPPALPLALDLDRLAFARHLDTELLDGWTSLTESYAQLRPVQPPAELLPMLEAHLHTLRSRVSEGAGTGPLWRRLLSLTAGTAVLAGWVSFTAERRRNARDHLELAEALGREVDDRDILVLTLMLRADLLSAVPSGGQEGLPDLARRRLHAAVELTSATTALALGAPVLLRAAEECAYTGMERDCLRHLDEAAALVGRAQARHHPLRPQWGRSQDVERVLVAFRGNCLQMLGRTAEAIDLLSEAESAFPGDRMAMLTDLAAAHGRQGDLDQACQLLIAAADLNSGHSVPLVVRRVVGVRRRHLARWEGEPAVRALDERLSLIL